MLHACYGRCEDQPEAEVVERASTLMRQMLRVLAEFALWLTQNATATGTDSQSFTMERLDVAVEKIQHILTLPQTPAQIAPWVLDSGVLQRISKDHYEFKHPTYREYLTAVALARRLAGPDEKLAGDTDKLAHAQRFSSAWSEPMRMLPGAAVAESTEDGRAWAVRWLGELRALALDPTVPEAEKALELAVASLSDIPGVAELAAEIDAATLLDAWFNALLQAARAGPVERLGSLSRLATNVASLPPALRGRAQERFTRALGDASQPDLQIAAATALARTGDFASVEALTAALHGATTRPVRMAVAQALATVERSDHSLPGHATLRQDLRGADIELGRTIAEAIREVGRLGLPLMLEAVAPGRDPEVRRSGTLALAGAGGEAIPRLRELQRDDDPEVCEAAIAALRQLGVQVSELQEAVEELERRGAGEAVLGRALETLLPTSLRQLGFTARAYSGVSVIVPPLSKVPGGKFLMGGDRRRDKQAYYDEWPQHRVIVRAFQIAKTPVTVTEYAAFLRATSHKAPSDWERQARRLEHPVVYVSWYDAIEYAKWLARVTGEPWRLSGEAEWEKAARGTDGRIYPWGDQFDPNRCNTIESRKGSTTPVGSYPNGASPCGALDMAGNVWEWTASVFKPYSYVATDGREYAEPTEPRVLRGGSWSYLARYAHAACRVSNVPRFPGAVSIGFRLVLAGPIL